MSTPPHIPQPPTTPEPPVEGQLPYYNGMQTPYAGQTFPAPQMPAQQQQQPYGYPSTAPSQPAAHTQVLQGLLDFGFRHNASPALAKIFYILAIVINVATWLGLAVVMFTMGSPNMYHVEGNPLLGTLFLVFGWIPALFNIIMYRMFAELVLSVLNVGSDLKAVRAKIDAA